MTFKILSNSLYSESLEADPIAKEFDLLDNEVSAFTEHRASIKFVTMNDDEAKVYFEHPDVENYWVDLKYTLKEGNVEHLYRNRFAYISYNSSFPVQIGSPLLEDAGVQKIEDRESLQNIIKKVVAEKSFERSLLKAKKGTR